MNQIKTSIIDYKNGIYAIDQQMVRAFLIVGSDKALLLDTGAIRINIKTYIKKITTLPLEVVLTHRDGDHIGNLQDFKDAYVFDKDMAGVLSHKECRNVSLHSIREGDIFDVGGRKLSVLYTPGHTPGSICLIDRENKILFSGDTISYGPVYMFGDRRDKRQYLTSLKRLQKMRDDGIYDTVYCCHNVCPVPTAVIEDLIRCTLGIINGTIIGSRFQLPIQNGPGPYIGKYGECGILFDKDC